MQDHEGRTFVTKSEVQSEVAVSNIDYSFVRNPRYYNKLKPDSGGN
jgi:hypothetical protein